MKIGTLWRVVWPERGPLFVVVGAIVSLLSDFASFLGNIASPQLLLLPAAGLAAVLAWLCLARVGGAPEPQRDAAVACRECDAFRVMLFASVGVVLLLMAGQGTTATERIGAQLGLIQRDVAAIREDTAAIRDVTASSELVRNPRSAADLFHNAWIYANVRRDNAAAWETVRTLYERHTPNKLDAAELYLNIGRGYETRAALLEQMAAIGIRRRDAAMLVIAGRNVESNEQALQMYAQAQEIDPDLPFAYWDIARVGLYTIEPGATASENLEVMRANVAGHRQFIEVAGRAPVARYFYVPQYQPDYENMAQSQLASFQRNAETWERLVQQQRESQPRRR